VVARPHCARGVRRSLEDGTARQEVLLAAFDALVATLQAPQQEGPELARPAEAPSRSVSEGDKQAKAQSALKAIPKRRESGWLAA